MTINVAGYKNIYLSIAGALTLASLVCIAVAGFHFGIDFTGGTLWQFSAPGNGVASDAFAGFFKNDLGVSGALVNTSPTDGSMMVRLAPIDEQDHQRLLKTVQEKFPDMRELSFQSIGPSVSSALRRNALFAIVFVLVGISLYIAYAFRKVSHPVSSWRYGFVTLLTLFHDVVIPAGLIALLGRYFGVELDTNFIVALLVVMGFSVHDTIVVFDRMRENLSLDRAKTDFAMLVNRSVTQTVARSINTSLTLVLVLVALLVTGPATLHYFVLTLLVGVIAGTYSSIFVASPALILMSRAKTVAS